MGILDWLRKASPAELREVKTALETIPALDRAEMDPAERKALGAGLAEQYELVMVRGQARFAADQQAREVQLGKLRGELDRLTDSRRAEVDSYTASRDAILSRLWAERPALSDELIARCEQEAAALRPEAITFGVKLDPLRRMFRGSGQLVTPDGPLEHLGGRSVSNAHLVEARQRGLYSLAEQVREWTRKGQYSTPAELEKLFDAGYRVLPVVVSARELAGRAA